MNRGRRRAEWRERVRQQNAVVGAPDRTSVNLRVNELVFRGFPRSAVRRIASDFERELTTLLQSRPLPAAWRTGAHINHAATAPLRLRSLTDTRGVGEQLARAIFGLRGSGQKAEAGS